LKPGFYELTDGYVQVEVADRVAFDLVVMPDKPVEKSVLELKVEALEAKVKALEEKVVVAEKDISDLKAKLPK
jgi:chaperonin cofactor prefoldin